MTAEEFTAPCWDAAFDVARRYREFDSYGSQIRAIRALRRRCPGLSAEQAAYLFRRSLELWQAAVEVVAANADCLWQQFRADPDVDLTRLDGERERWCPDVPLETWRSALGWIWFWHHLK